MSLNATIQRGITHKVGRPSRGTVLYYWQNEDFISSSSTPKEINE